MGKSLSKTTSGTARSDVITPNPAADKATNFMQAENHSPEQADIRNFYDKEGDSTFKIMMHPTEMPDDKEMAKDLTDTFKFKESSIERVNEVGNFDNNIVKVVTKEDGYVTERWIDKNTGEEIKSLKTSEILYDIGRFIVKIATGKDWDDSIVSKEVLKDYKIYGEANAALANAGISLNLDNVMNAVEANRDMVSESMIQGQHALSMYNISDANICDKVSHAINKEIEKNDLNLEPISSAEVSLNLHNSDTMQDTIDVMTAAGINITMHGLEDFHNPEVLGLFMNRVAETINSDNVSIDSYDSLLLNIGAVVQRNEDGSFSCAPGKEQDMQDLGDALNARRDFLMETNHMKINFYDVEKINDMKRLDEEYLDDMNLGSLVNNAMSYYGANFN